MALIYRSPVNANHKESYEDLTKELAGSSFCYGGYKELCGVLHKYCKTSDHILAAGFACDKHDCSLIEDFYDAGYHSVAVVDTSETLVCGLRERNKEKRPELQFVVRQVHDVKAEFDSEIFSVVIDRGVLDKVQMGNSAGQRTESNIIEYFKEVQRLLKVGGRYLCFTVATEEILDKLLDYFSSGWFFRVHLLGMQTSVGRPVYIPVFCFVLTKTKFTGSSSQSLQIIEMCLDGTETIQRLSDFSDIKRIVQEIQQYFVMKKTLEKCCAGQHFNVDLHLASGSSKQRDDARYSMTVVDIQRSLAKNGKFAIFIIPQGRETEWLFASFEGLNELASNAGFERVVVAALGRGHSFTDMDTIKKELSAKVMELAPKTLNRNAQVPFLSVGEDLGNRVVLHEGNSALSGDYVVEDVDGDAGHKYRRLIFLDNKNGVQSEARLTTSDLNKDKTSRKKKKGKPKAQAVNSANYRVNHGYLAYEYHRVIVTGLAWIEGFAITGEAKSGLIVGLGGGGLAMFLYHYFKQLSLEVIELDPSICEIAKSWFEFKEDERMKVIIEDGLKYIQSKESQATYDVIIFDVDSKDISVGMSSPPQAFVDKAFLTQVQSLLTPSGVFILSLVCRSTTLREQVMSDLHTVFPELYSIKIEGEVNEIVMALSSSTEQTRTEDKNPQETLRASFRKSVKELEMLAKGQEHTWDSTLDLCKLVQNLQIE